MIVTPRTSMSPAFLAYVDSTIVKEGGAAYTNDPADHGGATKYGITQSLARAAGYQGDMRDLTADQATSIYWTMMWIQPGYDRINAVAPDLAAVLFDLGVNNGTGWPGKWLQRCLNVLNQQGSAWPDLTVDGSIGMVTAAAVNSLGHARGHEGIRVLIAMIRALAGVRYIELAEADPSQERFEFGWESQRAFPGK